MRLVCPNCEAKYEVPEDAIPETGRDVQCANCGHAWYQMRARTAVAEPAAPVIEAPKPPVAEPAMASPEPVPEPVLEPVAEPAVASAVKTSDPEGEVDPPVAAPDKAADQTDAPVEVTHDTSADLPTEPTVEAGIPPTSDAPAIIEAALDGAAAAAAGADAAVMDTTADAVDSTFDLDDAGDPPEGSLSGTAPAAYAVDDSVLAILREEAAREAAARKTDTGKPLEVQTDLGLRAAPPVARKPVEVISTDDDTVLVAEDDVDSKLAARRSRLPDVEEIKSTLRPNADPLEAMAAEPEPVAAEGRSSFRSGFLLVMAIAILGMALYASADTLANTVPALAGPLKAYVGFVDGLRLQLDGLIQSATLAIGGKGT